MKNYQTITPTPITAIFTTLLLVATACTAPIPQPEPQPKPDPISPTVGINYTFNNDTQGWKVLGDASTAEPTHHSTGHLCAKDSVTGGVWYWLAPITGDHSALYGQTLNYKLKQNITNSQFVDDDVVITSGTMQLAYRFPKANYPATTFTNYTVQFLPTGWKNLSANREATTTEMKNALANITRLTIRGEYRTGSDMGCLDDVVTR